MDLFDAIRCLYTKEDIDYYPSTFILHRFLASDKELAPFVAEISKDLKDPERIWLFWQSILPKAKKAPFFKYAAPKKRDVNDALKKGLMKQKRITEKQADEFLEFVLLLGIEEEICIYYGIDE